MSGSVMARSRSSTRAVTAATTAAAVVSSGRNAEVLAQPVGLHRPQRWCRGCRSSGGPGSARSTTSTRSAPTRVTRSGQRAVEGDPAVVDDEDPVAEPLDVGQVVRGEQHGRAALGALADQEAAQSLLAHQVQADGRLVEHEQLRRVQQGGRDLAAHPLPERQLADRGVQERLHLEQRDALVEPRLPGRGGQPVDRGQQPERLAQRQVPPQLAALAEHRPDPARERGALADRLQAADLHRAADVGTRMPVSILMVVDLPAPLAPM